MWLYHSSSWSLLVALSLATIAESSYYNNPGGGNQRGSKFQCTQEGYYGDPQDCKVYYRCVDFGNGGPLVQYKFECGPGTVFSSDQGDICTYPDVCGRPECGGTNEQSDKINDIDSNNTPGTEKEKPGNHGKPESQPSPTPPRGTCPSCKPSYGPGSAGTTAAVTQTTVRPTQGYSSTAASASDPSSTGQASNTPNFGTECTCAGFLADPRDCSKFYRCVDDGNGGFQKYDFNCGDGTVWDPKSETCNYPWAANREGCQSSSNSNPPNQPSDGSGSTAPSHESTEPTMTVTWFPGSDSPGSSSGTPPSVPPSSGSPSQESSGTAAPDSGTQGTGQEPNASNVGTECTCAGFLADPADCAKFYRCVDAGNGLFQKYEFSCGDGTVWDPSSETCNHPWAANRPGCGGSMSSNPPNQSVDGSAPSQGSDLPSSTVGPSSESTPSYVNPDEESSSAGSSTEPASESTPSYVDPDQESSPAESSTEPDSESTPSYVDPNQESSPAESSTEPDSESTPSYDKPDPESTSADSSTEPAPASTPSYVDPGQESGSTPRPTATTSGPTGPSGSPNQGGNCNNGSGSGGSTGGRPQCTSEGFMADPRNCQKFYRCVNEAGSLNIYEFECGPGTTWDQKLLTCSHPWQSNVPECRGSGAVTPPQKVPSYGGRPTSPPSEASTEVPSYEGSSMAPSSEGSSEVPSYEGSSPVPPSEASTKVPSDESSATSNQGQEGSSPPNSPSSSCGSCPQCKSEGFFPNEKDCTKYYRCVKNERRGYSRFEFTCGPGTAWDQQLLTCNYIHQVASCRGPSKPADMTTSPGSSTEDSSSSSSSGSSSGSSSSSPSGSSSSSPSESSTSSSSSESSTPSSSSESSESGSSSRPCDKPMPPTNGIVCNQEGFYANPNDCGKFYRCVNNGNGFNVYHFDCAPGTIFDPSTSNCNYASAIYPPRNCNVGQSGGDTGAPGANQPPACEGTGSSSTMNPGCGGNNETEQEPGTTDTSTNSTPDFGSTPSQETTTDASAESSASTVTGSFEENVTEVTSTPSDESTEGGESTTQEEETTTEEEETTTSGYESSPGTETATSGTTPASEETTTESEESSTEVATTQPPPPAGSVTCPIGNLTGEQIALVCPTGFRRHPKYCNIFYQCTTDADMSVKILSFHCPEGTIFDDSHIECVPEEMAAEPCNGVTAGARVYRRVEESPMSLVDIEQRETLCPGEGYYPHNHETCSNVFYRCKKSEGRSLQGYLYKCPDGFVFWDVSRRCERRSRLPMCSSNYSNVNQNENEAFERRWQLPVETYNRSARKIPSQQA